MDRLEWWNYATKNGTRGDMVLDILEDWKKSDAKTAHLVAQEMIKELEEDCPHIPDVFDWKKRQCLICFDAIKSKWVIE